MTTSKKKELIQIILTAIFILCFLSIIIYSFLKNNIILIIEIIIALSVLLKPIVNYYFSVIKRSN